jgi:tetratricopeptide (TPR) repeat protein
MKRRIQALDVYMKAVVVLDQALSIDPRQRDLLEKRQEVGRRVGLLALGSKDFQLARHAFSRLRAIGVNETEVDALLNRVTTVQSALYQWRAQRLEEILSDLREGLSRNGRAPGSPLIEDYCLECAGYRDKQTVEILSGKHGLKSLVERVASGAEKIVFSQAERDIAKFVCRVLGRIQLEESLPPLLEWAQIVPDPELAIEVGIALCNTRREEAGGAVRSLRERFGADSNVWQRIGRYYPRIPGLPESKSTSDLDSQIERGKEWLVRKNYVRALEVYEKILSTAPNDRDALAGMGSVYLAQGRMKEAERYFCRALETTGPLRGPKSVLLTNRGYARFQLGRHAEAHEDCDRSLELDRERSRSHVLKGLLCLQTKDFSEARKHLDRGIRLDPEVTMGYIARGNLHSAQKEYEKALADYDRAIDLDPQLSIAYVNRANVYRQTRRYESAMRDIGRALELSPNNLLAYLNRGMLFNARKDGRSALNDFDQALRIQPRSRRARFGRGIAHMILNQPREAVDDFNAAYSLGNRTWDLLLRRGRCYYFIKEYEKSVVDFDRVLRARPNLRGANYLRGLSYLALQKYEKALADSESALVVDPGLAGAYKMRAQCRMKLGKTEGVVEDLRKYLSLSPQAKDRETIERLIRQKSSR